MSTSTVVNNVSEKDLLAFKEKKINYFKGSIAVCVIYGVLALGLLAVAIMSQKMQESFQSNFMPFLSTLITGIFLIVGILIAMLWQMQAPTQSPKVYSVEACPDYWTQEVVSKEEMDLMRQSGDINVEAKSIRCVPNWAFANNAAPTVELPNNSTNEDVKLLQGKASTLFGTGATSAVCNAVYPQLFGQVDNSEALDSNNYRCAYSRLCKVPWTAACPQTNTF
jgi:hypothetical protein